MTELQNTLCDAAASSEWPVPTAAAAATTTARQSVRPKSLFAQLFSLSNGFLPDAVDVKGLCANLPKDARLTIDSQFASMCVSLAADEWLQLEQLILRHQGAYNPLIVWKWNGHYILLDGHNRLLLCLLHGLRFSILVVEHADRPAAEREVSQTQLGRRNASKAAASYLRGKRYQQEKGPRGGSHKTPNCNDCRLPAETAGRLALEYGVSEKTIYNDAKLAAAVDRIAANCGDEARNAMLDRDGLTIHQIRDLAKLEVSEQRHKIDVLIQTGALPEPDDDTRATLTLPFEARPFARKLVRRLGAEAATERLHAIAIDLAQERGASEIVNQLAKALGLATRRRSQPTAPKVRLEETGGPARPARSEKQRRVGTAHQRTTTDDTETLNHEPP